MARLKRKRSKSSVEAEPAHQIQVTITAGVLEAARLQRRIDELQAVQKAAVAAGTYKGRQLLYLESLKQLPRRANQPRGSCRRAARARAGSCCSCCC